MSGAGRPKYSLTCALLVVIACGDTGEPDSVREPRPDSVVHTTTAPASHNPAQTPSTAPLSSGCLIDEGGCRAKVDALDTCESDAVGPALTVDDVLDDPSQYIGRPIAIRGPLIRSGAECTELACERTCCNTCTSIMAISNATGTDHIRLHSARKPGLFLCRGDESSVCCQFPTNRRQTIAQGTFQATIGIKPTVYQLFATELCTPSTDVNRAAGSAGPPTADR